jgi:Phage integrase, N-terminal SAM-like domain
MTGDRPARPAWKRLMSSRARKAVEACATPDDVRRLGEPHFLQMPGLLSAVVGEIGTTIGGWDTDPAADGDQTDIHLLAPAVSAVPAELRELADKRKHYARGAKAANTLRAYESDWRHFECWCRRLGRDPSQLKPDDIGDYIADMAAGKTVRQVNVRTIERRLSAICWAYKDRNKDQLKQQTLDLTKNAPARQLIVAIFNHLQLRFNRQILGVSDVLDGIRRQHSKPPVKKLAIKA